MLHILIYNVSACVGTNGIAITLLWSTNPMINTVKYLFIIFFTFLICVKTKHTTKSQNSYYNI